MQVSSAGNEKFFGLVELGIDGTVLYSRAEPDDGNKYSPKLVGRNFFREAAPFGNVEEFQRHLKRFSQSSDQANSLPFTCEYEDGPVKVKILLARVRERSDSETTKSILVHIRKAQ
jgi:photoactive yellow protein